MACRCFIKRSTWSSTVYRVRVIRVRVAKLVEAEVDLLRTHGGLSLRSLSRYDGPGRERAPTRWRSSTRRPTASVAPLGEREYQGVPSFLDSKSLRKFTALSKVRIVE